MNLADLRRDYSRHGLHESEVDPDPIVQFDAWFRQAQAAGLMEPNAMTLATADADGRPSARIVLLKGYDERGFCFFTSYLGRKARELAANPHAALVFHWVELERQVRIDGAVERVEPELSDEYFLRRPRESRLAARCAPQSDIIPSRETLETAYRREAAEFEGREVVRPETWGGYRVVPHAIEFWQGRPSRLHDRIEFRRDAPADPWTIVRLAP